MSIKHSIIQLMLNIGTIKTIKYLKGALLNIYSFNYIYILHIVH